MSVKHRGHIFKRFDTELNRLHQVVLQMGELATAQLRAAVSTLGDQDVERAAQVIENDKELNRLDVIADDEIIRIIALRQPMARDLRELIAISKIIAELERAGDEARKIANLTIRLYTKANPSPLHADLLQDIYSLSEYVSSMLVNVMQALDNLDTTGAVQVLKQDLELDEQLQSSLRHLSDFIRQDARHVEYFIDIVLGIRALERFGGHAKNIAGHIVFIKNGIDVRHEDVQTIVQILS